MSNMILHPGLILIASGILSALVPEKVRKVVMVAGPSLALAAMFMLSVGDVWSVPFINGMELQLLSVDRLNWVFGLVFSMTALIGSIYALHNKGWLESLSSLVYAGSSLGVTLCGDFMTLMFFWELMAASSLFLIWANKSERAVKAGFRYLLVHMFGGNCLLIGVILKVAGGTFLIGDVTAVHDASFWLILIGVAINAAIPPLHGWLPDAYPEANITGSVFLSSFTTKVAVYCLIRMFAGTQFLIVFGVIMALYGAIFAIMQQDVRRILSYHIVSQVGFMVAGVGIGTSLALDGATAHAFSHILYKSLLFMGAGGVIYATGINKINELGGLAKKMPFVCAAFAVGSFSIAGVPLFNGFISKSITVTAACEAGYSWAELGLLVASVGTFLSIVMKLLYFMFFGEDKGIEVKPVPLNMKVAMGIGSALCILFGLFPQLLYQYLPFEFEYHPFTWDHIMQYTQLLLVSIVPFIMYIESMHPHDSVTLDTDWLYRKPFAWLVRTISSFCVSVQVSLGEFFRSIYDGAQHEARNPLLLIGEGSESDLVPEEEQAPDAGAMAAHVPHELAVYDPDKAREPIGEIMSVVIFVLIIMIAFIALFGQI